MSEIKNSLLNGFKAIDENIKIVEVEDYPRDKYFERPEKITQGFIHHTVSGPGITGDLNTWKKLNGIGTSIIISRDGTINIIFNPFKYRAYHLGLKYPQFAKFGLPFKWLDYNSFAIELDSWGGLIKKNGKLYNAYGGVVDVPIVQYKNGFRGWNIFEKYTHDQLNSLWIILQILCYKLEIPTNYNVINDLDKNALSGKSGIYTHVAVNPEKSDCHPQKELIELLNNL